MLNMKKIIFWDVGGATKFGFGEESTLANIKCQRQDVETILSFPQKWTERFWRHHWSWPHVSLLRVKGWWEECRSWSWTGILVWVWYVHVYDRKVKTQFSSTLGSADWKEIQKYSSRPDAASELTNAASRLCWKISPSIARTLRSCH